MNRICTDILGNITAPPFAELRSPFFNSLVGLMTDDVRLLSEFLPLCQIAHRVTDRENIECNAEGGGQSIDYG